VISARPCSTTRRSARATLMVHVGYASSTVPHHHRVGRDTDIPGEKVPTFFLPTNYLRAEVLGWLFFRTGGSPKGNSHPTGVPSPRPRRRESGRKFSSAIRTDMPRSDHLENWIAPREWLVEKSVHDRRHRGPFAYVLSGIGRRISNGTISGNKFVVGEG